MSAEPERPAGGDSPLPPLAPIPSRNLAAKRLLDLALSLPVATVALPLLGLIALAYRLDGVLFPEDRGPAFFRVFRHARGRTLLLTKVRLSRQQELHAAAAAIDARAIARLGAYLCAEDRARIAQSPEFLVEDRSPRRTHVGRAAKAVYLDELPQILNVLRGEMSLVGPRPLPLDDARTRPGADGLVTLGGASYDYRHREALPGGLTGRYQTNKSAAAKENYLRFIQEGVALDREYYDFLARATPWQVVREDLAILLRTLPIVLEHQGV